MTPDGARAHPETFGIAPDIYHRRWAILAVLAISLVTVVTAVSSLNVALPTIQRSLGASGTQLQWILDAYALVFAGLLLPAGAIGDRFGRKGALQFGLVVFGLASFLGSRAADPAQVIALRAVMGVGAAFIMPATLSIIVNSFPFHERPKAVAVWAAFAGVGGALGPITSGVLLAHFWWGSVFFINLPLVIVLLVLSAFIVPTSRDPHGHALDPIGAVISVVGLVALVFGVIEGPVHGWTDPLTLGAFALATVALCGFVTYELRVTHPMLDPRLFRVRGFSAGSITVTLVFFNMFAMFFLITQYLQFVRGYSPLAAGLSVLPNAVTMLIVSPQGPRFVARFGVQRVVRTGFLVATVGFTLLAFATADTPYALIAVALVCTGGGIALIMPPASQHIIGSLPLAKSGVGSAVNDVTREVGGALGIAVAGSVAYSVYRTTVDLPATMPPEAQEVARESIGQTLGIGRIALEQGRITPEQFHDLAVRAGEAFSQGTRVAFLMAAAIAVFAGLVVTRWLPDALPTRQAGTPSPGAPHSPDSPVDASVADGVGSRSTEPEVR